MLRRTGTDSRRIDLSTLGNSVLEELLPVDSVMIVFDQYLFDQLLNSQGDPWVVRNDHVFIFQHFDQLGNRFALEWTFSKEHLVENDTYRPDIGLDSVYLSFYDLGSHVDRRAQHSLSELVRILERFAESKVSHFNTPVVQ